MKRSDSLWRFACGDVFLIFLFRIFFRLFWHERIHDITLGYRDIAMWQFLWRGAAAGAAAGIGYSRSLIGAVRHKSDYFCNGGWWDLYIIGAVRLSAACTPPPRLPALHSTLLPSIESFNIKMIKNDDYHDFMIHYRLYDIAGLNDHHWQVDFPPSWAPQARSEAWEVYPLEVHPSDDPPRPSRPKAGLGLVKKNFPSAVLSVHQQQLLKVLP